MGNHLKRKLFVLVLTFISLFILYTDIKTWKKGQKIYSLSRYIMAIKIHRSNENIITNAKTKAINILTHNQITRMIGGTTQKILKNNTSNNAD